MIDKVVLNGAVEDHDPDVLVGFQGVDEFLKLADHYRAHDVDRRVIDGDSPIGRRPLVKADLFGVGR